MIMKEYDDDNDSIIEFKKWFAANANLDMEIECPCCSQLVKIYKRDLDWSMIAFLIAIVKLSKIENKVEFRHNQICDYAKNNLGIFPTNYALTKKWDLVLSPKNGYYCLSPIGYRFLNNEITLPSFLIIYNNVIIQKSKTLINVFDVDKEKVNKYIIKNRNKSDNE